jgi:undecaprenyl-diphosphatase
VLLEHPVRVALAKPLTASIFLVVNGLILLAAERVRRRSQVRALAEREGMKRDGGRRLETLEYREAGIIGVAQSTALIAGISRDGMAMATGLVRGLDNEDAARFAFLLATPPILLAGLYKFGDLTGPLGAGIRGQAVVAAIAAAITAVITVHFLMRYFKTNNLTPFGIYCIVFGAAMVVYNA